MTENKKENEEAVVTAKIGTKESKSCSLNLKRLKRRKMRSLELQSRRILTQAAEIVMKPDPTASKGGSVT